MRSETLAVHKSLTLEHPQTRTIHEFRVGRNFEVLKNGRQILLITEDGILVNGKEVKGGGGTATITKADIERLLLADHGLPILGANGLILPQFMPPIDIAPLEARVTAVETATSGLLTWKTASEPRFLKIADVDFDASTREKDALIFYDGTKYSHIALHAINDGVIGEIALINNNITVIRQDINKLRVEDQNIYNALALKANQLEVDQKASKDYVDAEIAEPRIGGIVVDITGRTADTIVAFDGTKYVHKPLSSAMGALSNRVDALEANKADKTELTTKVEKAYVDNAVANKADASTVTGKADKTYVDAELAKKQDSATAALKTELAGKSDVGHSHKMSDLSDFTIPIPPPFGFSTPSTTLYPTYSKDFTIPASAFRFFGLSVVCTQLTGAQKLLLTIFKDAQLTDVAYLAEFTADGYEDWTQPWLYRNTSGKTEIYVRISNTGTQTVSNFFFTVKMEPA